MKTEEINELFEKSIAKSRELFETGHLDSAYAVLNQLLRCDENNKQALQLIGLVHQKKGEYGSAVSYYERAIANDPDNPDNYNNIALSLSSMGKIHEGIEHLRHAIDLCRGDGKMLLKEAQFRSNLGIQLRLIRQYEEAIMQLKIALDYNNNDPVFWQNLGGIYGENHQIEMAVEQYRKSIQLDPNNPVAHADLAHGLHLLGHAKEAWEHYEWRYKAISCFPTMALYNQRLDPKKQLKTITSCEPNQTIIVFGEQGIGDTLQFVRYLPNLKAETHCKIIFQCGEETELLLKNNSSSLGIDELFVHHLYDFQIPIPEHDHHCSLLSLPYLLKIPTKKADRYIEPSKKANLGEGFKIGIAWGGNPIHPNDVIRSCPLKFFKPLSELPGVKLFSLQKEIAPRIYKHQTVSIDLTEGADFKVTDLREYMKDFDSTASLIDDLNMVISVDTSVLHLAAALYKPCVGLISYNPCWRWEIDSISSPWYASLRLARQNSPGDWAGAMTKAVEYAKEQIQKAKLVQCTPTIE